MKHILIAFSIIVLINGPAFAGDGAKKFKSMDTNKDGMITDEEFNAYSDKKFSKMDADNDGSVSVDEMKKHMMAKKKSKYEMKDSYMKEKKSY